MKRAIHKLVLANQKNKIKEFERQLNEATRAAHSSLTIMEKVACVQRAQEIKSQLEEARKKFKKLLDAGF